MRNAALAASGLVLVFSSAMLGGDDKGLTLKVLLPEIDAALHIDGTLIDGDGWERKVTVRPQKGAEQVKVTAVWKPNGYTEIRRTRMVPVKKRETIVDVREPDAKAPDQIEVIYVPTPIEVVEAMCRLGKVGPDDVVYDLGCGDGRIVITAVSTFKAKRGVGVDINANLVKQSTLNAKKDGMSDKVEFRQGDVLEIKDLSTASVVMLYMGEDINLRLRPILQKTLKPGARIVSHSFGMGDWQPTRTETVASRTQGDCDLHLWVVDAATASLTDGKYEDIRRAVAALEKQGALVEVKGGRLSITGGQVTADTLAGLKVLTELRELELSKLVLTEQSVERLSRLKSLHRLRIINSRVTMPGLKHLKNLNALEGLTFTLTPIDDASLEFLGAIKTLKELDLSLTTVSDAGLDAIASLSGLQKLNLDGAGVTDSGLKRIAGFADLQWLSLCHTRVTDAGLAQLQGLKKLKHLNLRGTRTSPAGVQMLRRALPEALILHSPNLFSDSLK